MAVGTNLTTLARNDEAMGIDEHTGICDAALSVLSNKVSLHKDGRPNAVMILICRDLVKASESAPS